MIIKKGHTFRGFGRLWGTCCGMATLQSSSVIFQNNLSTCSIFQDNEISSFKRGTFHSQANPELRILDLSFNLITDIQYDTFRFPRLERLLLDDNQISVLDSKSFVEMTQLVYLSLEGNRLYHIPGKWATHKWNHANFFYMISDPLVVQTISFGLRPNH